MPWWWEAMAVGRRECWISFHWRSFHLGIRVHLLFQHAAALHDAVWLITAADWSIAARKSGGLNFILDFIKHTYRPWCYSTILFKFVANFGSLALDIKLQCQQTGVLIQALLIYVPYRRTTVQLRMVYKPSFTSRRFSERRDFLKVLMSLVWSFQRKITRTEN